MAIRVVVVVYCGKDENQPREESRNFNTSCSLLPHAQPTVISGTSVTVYMTWGRPEAGPFLSLLMGITEISVLFFEPYPIQGKGVHPLLPRVQVEGVGLDKEERAVMAPWTDCGAH